MPPVLWALRNLMCKYKQCQCTCYQLCALLPFCFLRCLCLLMTHRQLLYNLELCAVLRCVDQMCSGVCPVYLSGSSVCITRYPHVTATSLESRGACRLLPRWCAAGRRARPPNSRARCLLRPTWCRKSSILCLSMAPHSDAKPDFVPRKCFFNHYNGTIQLCLWRRVTPSAVERRLV